MHIKGFGGRVHMKRMVYLIMICLALAGCGKKEVAANGPGSRSNPYTVGMAATYDGMKEKQENKHYQAEVILKDICRGAQAREIFEYGESSYGKSYEELVGEDMEMLIARFDVRVLKTEKDQSVSLEDNAITMFKLVSEDGQGYQYFPLRQYIDADKMLFSDLYEGGERTGHLFYLVKKEDRNPLIVFENKVNGGLWFKTTIPEEERGDDRIVVEDWIDPEKEAERAEQQEWQTSRNLSDQREQEAKEFREKYAGTLASPLRPGEWGLSIDRYGDYSLELCVLDFMRGEEAKSYVAAQNIHGLENGEGLESGKEFLVVHMQANLPELSEEKYKNGTFELVSYDFVLIHGQKGTEYSNKDKVRLNRGKPGIMLYQGTQDFYQTFIVDTADTSPKLYYWSGSDKLFFVISSEQEADSQKELYQPVNLADAFKKDTSKRKGSINNPYLEGEILTLNDQPAYEMSLDMPFKADIKLLESYRGEKAEQFFARSIEVSGADSELLVMKLEVSVLESKGNDAVSFDASHFMLFSETGGEVDSEYIFPSYLQDGLDDVYQGGTADGYIGFWIPKDENAVYLTLKELNKDEQLQFIEVVNGD